MSAPPSRASTKPRSSSTSTSTARKARPSTSRASSFRATPSPATRSSAASSCSKKARSTTPACGTSRCCASTSSTTSNRSRPSRTSESRQNTDDGTVDLLLKLKEKGKNSIGLNGGLSGLSGTFIGLNYETNNFLGLGETLSVVANIGDLSRNLSFGFTEPYLRNKPISLGIQVFDSKYDYNPAKAYSATGTQSANFQAAQNSQFTNYNTSTKGITLSLSEPLRHVFSRTGVTRVGASYSYSRASISTFNQNTQNVFQSLAFRSGVAGQNQLNGIDTSVVTPTFTFSSLDRASARTTARTSTRRCKLPASAATSSTTRPPSLTASSSR